MRLAIQQLRDSQRIQPSSVGEIRRKRANDRLPLLQGEVFGNQTLQSGGKIMTLNFNRGAFAGELK